MKTIFWFFEDQLWGIRCSYNLWLHGPYGLAKVIERIPFRYLTKYLRKYGATIGEGCRIEKGMIIHRPFGKKPFENLKIGNGAYLGHTLLIDLTDKVEIKDWVVIGARSQIWTHAGHYIDNKTTKPTYDQMQGPVLIKEYVAIFSNVIITAGITIGENAKVGACALVNKSVAANAFVRGVPATEKK
jgi:putative colanic acid biosynthesis acetyltransferase WcaF